MSGRFAIAATPLNGVVVVSRARIEDARGSLSRFFCAVELGAVGWKKSIAQINMSTTDLKGTIRGMHFQRPPAAEMKLVTCIKGEIFDVAVDLRASSPTFLKWHGERLSAENGRALMISEGFAHGFQTLTDDVELLYCHSASYVPFHEGGVRADDPTLAIQWPLSTSAMSVRDRSHPLIGPKFAGIEI
ncbi:dTDP-4-dehydrorhamnose 3,5-epimerase family protein [Pseudolabrys sp.]|uniref:dTDP-4-dehydrorhamnose 3,5-epimerase family protein n=1 Tax=Pseudolabrys sp. TaxID=1960880 RepID=UPI003D0ED5BE